MPSLSRLVILTVIFVASMLLVVGPSPVHASSPLVQQNSAGCGFGSCESKTVTVSFSSNVASGDVVVVGIDGFLDTVT